MINTIGLPFQDESIKQTAQLMYQTALMESGFTPTDPNEFASRIYNSVKSSLKVNPNAVVEEEDDAEEVETETDTKEAAATPEAEDDASKDDADTEPSAVKDEL